ncbi:MAG: hypothetical protein EOP00_34365, partial [Pedobacter sp.]
IKTDQFIQGVKFMQIGKNTLSELLKFANTETKPIEADKKSLSKVSPEPSSNSIFESLTLTKTKADKNNLNVLKFVGDNNSINTTESKFSQKISKTSLSTPTGYKEKKTTQLSAGINYNEFSTNNDASGKKTVRAVTISPEKYNKIGVQYADSKSAININDLSNSSQKPLLVMNGTFFGGSVAGDAKGKVHSKGQVNNGSFVRAEKSVAAKIDNRYTFAITNDNKPVIFKGGLYNPNEKTAHVGKNELEVKTALGGGVLLFDGANSAMYKAVGTKAYNSQLGKNNEKDIVNVNIGLSRECARSAVGIMPNGSIVLVNIGEGQYHREDEGGVTPAKVAKIMKDMGCVSAIMYDGGGAPTMKVKDDKGNTITNTKPNISDGYAAN